MIKRLLLILFSYLLSSVAAYAQNYPVRHFTVEDGLPSNTIYNIFKDSKGFLWITTDKGIARYNGVKFEKFTSADGLADNEIFFSKEDKEGRIWFSTFNGDLCYYKNDSFHNARNTPFLRMPKKHSFLNWIYIQQDGTVMFVYGQGYIYCIKGNKGYEVDLTNINFGNRNGVFYAQLLSKDKVLIYTNNETILIDISWSSPRVLKREQNPLYLPGCLKRITILANHSQEYLINECAAYNIKFNLLRFFPPDFTKKNYIYDMYYDGKDFFTSTNHGIYINDTIHIFEDDKVTGIAQDYNKDYWVSTLDNGIFSMSKTFLTSGIYYGAYTNKVVYTKELAGKLFFATEDEDLHVLDNGEIQTIFNGGRFMKTDGQYNSSAYLIDDNARYYEVSSTKTVIVDNILADVFKVRLYTSSTLDGYYSLKKIVNADNGIFINGAHNYFFVNYDNYAPGSNIKYEGLADSANSRIFATTKDADNTVWFSTLSKMYKVLNGKRVEQAQFGSIAFKNFDFIGKYLIGYTHNNELLVCKNYNDAIKVDTIVQNCIWDKFYKIDETHLLISTNELYYVLTVNNLESLPEYTVSAVENPFIPLLADAICVGDNYCYFFKGGDIIKMNKGNLIEDLPPPTVHFKTLKTVKNIYEIGRFMEIPFEDSRNMTISLSTISFGNQGVTYQYSISKNEKDNWTPLDGDLNLINPGYGVYTVKVRAKTASSGYGVPVTFTLHILRPYWATWWFVYLLVCSVIFVIWVIVQRRVRVTLAKKEKEHQNHVRFIKSEYKAMNALMNPHFIFNTLNNVQSLVNSNDKLGANEYLRVFADLIRVNMSNVSREMIPLQEEVHLVTNYLVLEKLRFEDRLSYSINVSGGVDMTEIMVPPLLLQPLVENSIKHGILPMKGKHGIVNIYIYERNDVLHIDVKDNGIGIEKAKESKSLHESFGLSNIQTRMEQLSIIQGKKLTFSIGGTKDTDGSLQWTVATITMPI